MDFSATVFVAMSGGVDSAVAAAQLLEEGYIVQGIFMDTWKDQDWLEETKHLPSPASLAKRNAEKLGIPFVKLDIRDRFFEDVVMNFVEQYRLGQTPNPCMFCNPQIKWGILQYFAFDRGASYFATGHYARIERLESDRVRLLKGVDSLKDQSYVLAMLSQSQLQRTLLPMGALTKKAVRLQAEALALPSAVQMDSQDLCFLGKVDYRKFLQRYAPDAMMAGEIVTKDGTVLGEHQGLASYTVGQRKGIRVAAKEPYYVIEKRVSENRLVVGHAHQASMADLRAIQANWISGEPPEQGDIYEVMVRYRARPAQAVLQAVTDNEFRLEFNQPLRGVSPGQMAVLYRGDECLGGGVIQASG